MIIRSMYFGRRRIVRVYRAGKLIWPAATELPLSAITNLFSHGYHALQFGEIIVLASCDDAVSVPAVSGAVLPITGLGAGNNSKTALDGTVLPADAMICAVDTAGIPLGEIKTLIMETVFGDHRQDSRTTPGVSGHGADAVYGEYGANITTAPEVEAEAPEAVSGAFSEDNSITDDASMEDTPEAATAASQAESTTSSGVAILPFRMDGVVEMDTDTGNRTEETAEMDFSEPVPMAPRLRLATTCKVHMLAAPAAGMKSSADSQTAAAIILHIDGEEPEESWYDTVQTGSNLYIRSVWLSYQDRDKVFIDTTVWYEVIRDGSNLYIRSADSVWTDGDSANIDTEFFLEPVQDGNNLYIRQNIFGGE